MITPNTTRTDVIKMVKQMILEDLKQKLKQRYTIKKITESNINDSYNLMKDNKYYYSRTQFHEVNLKECLNDLIKLPPDTEISQKFYIGIYEEDHCIALLDYVERYPKDSVVYLGLYMLSIEKHGKNIASSIINQFFECTKSNGFTEIKLSCYEKNEIGMKFWTKLGFTIEKESSRVIDSQTFKLMELQKHLK